MFDPAVETPIPLVQVPRLAWLPRRRHGRKLHPSTCFRWVQTGLRGVRLEAVKIGGTCCTSEEALKRFFAALSAASPLCAPNSPPPFRAPAARARAKRRAERETAAAGI